MSSADVYVSLVKASLLFSMFELQLWTNRRARPVLGLNMAPTIFCPAAKLHSSTFVPMLVFEALSIQHDRSPTQLSCFLSKTLRDT
jgi:hypothetical protein